MEAQERFETDSPENFERSPTATPPRSYGGSRPVSYPNRMSTFSLPSIPEFNDNNEAPNSDSSDSSSLFGQAMGRLRDQAPRPETQDIDSPTTGRPSIASASAQLRVNRPADSDDDDFVRNSSRSSYYPPSSRPLSRDYTFTAGSGDIEGSNYFTQDQPPAQHQSPPSLRSLSPFTLSPDAKIPEASGRNSGGSYLRPEGSHAERIAEKLVGRPVAPEMARQFSVVSGFSYSSGSLAGEELEPPTQRTDRSTFGYAPNQLLYQDIVAHPTGRRATTQMMPERTSSRGVLGEAYPLPQPPSRPIPQVPVTKNKGGVTDTPKDHESQQEASVSAKMPDPEEGEESGQYDTEQEYRTQRVSSVMEIPRFNEKSVFETDPSPEPTHRRGKSKEFHIMRNPLRASALIRLAKRQSAEDKLVSGETIARPVSNQFENADERSAQPIRPHRPDSGHLLDQQELDQLDRLETARQQPDVPPAFETWKKSKSKKKAKKHSQDTQDLERSEPLAKPASAHEEDGHGEGFNATAVKDMAPINMETENKETTQQTAADEEAEIPRNSTLTERPLSDATAWHSDSRTGTPGPEHYLQPLSVPPPSSDQINGLPLESPIVPRQLGILAPSSRRIRPDFSSEIAEKPPSPPMLTQETVQSDTTTFVKEGKNASFSSQGSRAPIIRQTISDRSTLLPTSTQTATIPDKCSFLLIIYRNNNPRCLSCTLEVHQSWSDRMFFKAIRHAYLTKLEGTWRQWTSLKTLKRIIPLHYEYENRPVRLFDPYAVAMQDFFYAFEHPGEHRGEEDNWVKWAFRLQAHTDHRYGFEFVEGWSCVKIGIIGGSILIATLAVAVIWVVFGGQPDDVFTVTIFILLFCFALLGLFAVMNRVDE